MNIIRKASSKIYALTRTGTYMDLSKWRMVMNTFFSSYFNYCPLVWMCYYHTTNSKINMLHGRCLRITCNDKQWSFKMHLEKESSVSIHNKNSQCLATEMYKVSNGISPSTASNNFEIVNLTICDLILRFPDLLLGLYFTGRKVYPILVQLSGTFLLIVRKTYLILVFLKTGLKNGNLWIELVDVAKDTYVESVLHRLLLQ